MTSWSILSGRWRQYPPPEPGPIRREAEWYCPRCGAALDQPLGRAPYCVDDLLEGVTRTAQ